MEHPWSRQHSMVKVFLPVCESMNQNPSKEDRAWTKKCAFEKYGIKKLKELNPKKDWDKELLQVNFYTRQPQK